MSRKVYLAIDLGAGSGRVIAGKINATEAGELVEDSLLELEELHRFENNGSDLPSGFYWNIIGIYQDILLGLRKGIAKYGDQVVSIGIDTWGCDYGLIDRDGEMIGNPHQYRDDRSEGMAEAADRILGQEKIYASTGVMPAFYNTSGHLLAEKTNKSKSLSVASHLLFIPDLLGYFLTGKMANEQTVASTSQLYNPLKKDWAWDVIDGLGLPRQIFGTIIKPGEILGSLSSELSVQLGAKTEIRVVAAPSHDTASAVAGIPIGDHSAVDGGRDVWISSGTWSIMGVELAEPILSEQARLAGFANELGVNDSVRFLKNISGLWLIQECRRYWADQGEELDYAELTRLSECAEPFTAFIDPDDPRFAVAGEMPQKVAAYCVETGQSEPQGKGAILRVISESLALKYRVIFDQLSEVLGENLGEVYMGGGGIQNQLIAQNASDAIGREIIAGPIEATSCGNLITQMVGMGDIADIASGRELVRRSNSTQTYVPTDADVWQQQLARFKSVTNIH